MAFETTVVVGRCVLVECPQRWYIGRVAVRGGISFVLELAAAVHQIGDLGQFMEGVITEDTDITPLADLHEVGFQCVQTVGVLREAALLKLRVRTHARRPEKRPTHKDV